MEDFTDAPRMFVDAVVNPLTYAVVFDDDTVITGTVPTANTPQAGRLYGMCIGLYAAKVGKLKVIIPDEDLRQQVVAAMEESDPNFIDILNAITTVRVAVQSIKVPFKSNKACYFPKGTNDWWMRRATGLAVSARGSLYKYFQDRDDWVMRPDVDNKHRKKPYNRN